MLHPEAQLKNMKRMNIYGKHGKPARTPASYLYLSRFFPLTLRRQGNELMRHFSLGCWLWRSLQVWKLKMQCFYWRLSAGRVDSFLTCCLTSSSFSQSSSPVFRKQQLHKMRAMPRQCRGSECHVLGLWLWLHSHNLEHKNLTDLKAPCLLLPKAWLENTKSPEINYDELVRNENCRSFHFSAHFWKNLALGIVSMSSQLRLS